jgi:MFS family permease
MKSINRNQLFVASCLALLVTSLSFGIRAGILNDLGTQFNLNASQLGTIAATAFWGFPLAIIIGGMLVDVIGMKRFLIIAFVLLSTLRTMWQAAVAASVPNAFTCFA